VTFTLQNRTTNPIFEMVERQTESAEDRLAKLWQLGSVKPVLGAKQRRATPQLSQPFGLRRV